MKRKILILGATGFLGKNLVRYLKSFYHNLALVDLPPNTFDRTSSSYFLDNVVIHADITSDIHVIKAQMKDADTVIHLANRARIEPSWMHYKSYYETNIGATQQMFALAQTLNVRRFVYVSSSSVYGNVVSDCQQESDRLYPTNPYSVSKMAAEFALQAQRQMGKTELLIVRPFTMYGDYMEFGEYGLVIGKFIKAWQNDEPLMLHGGGKQTRDFLHGSDAVRGLWAIVEKGKDGEVYNLGSGKSVSIKQLADVVSDKQIIVPERKGHVQSTRADITKLKDLGWSPQIDVIMWLTQVMEELTLSAE